MSVARVTEISSRSTSSFEDAVKTGVERASKTLRGLQSAWIKEQRVEVNDQGKITSCRSTCSSPSCSKGESQPNRSGPADSIVRRTRTRRSLSIALR